MTQPLGDPSAQQAAPAAAAAPPAVGGAAVLARLRAQRAAAANVPAATAPAPVAAAKPAPTSGTPVADAKPTAAAVPEAAAAKPSVAAVAAPAPAAASPPPLAAAVPAPAATKPAAAAGPPAATGGAAILARLRASRQAKETAVASKVPATRQLVVLYASQTGTAQEIAKNVQAEAEQKGIKGRVASMNEFGFENLTAAQAPVVVYVASSTGDGDAPDNSAKFYATLRRKTQPDGLLAGVAFTGFGLGDSNYTRYQYVPRAIKQRFMGLGAEQFYEYGEADEVDGIEEGLDKWLEGLWPALRKAVQVEGSTAPDAAPAADGAPAAAVAAADEGLKGVPPLPRCRVQLVWEASDCAAAAVRQAELEAPRQAELARRDAAGQYSAELPFWAPVTEARYLTTELSGADRQVLHLELDISDSGMQYAPGDSIGVLPENDPTLVTAVIERLGLESEAVFNVAPTKQEAEADGAAAAAAEGHPEHLLPHLHAPCSVRAALSRGVDLTGPPRKSLLRLLAEHCSEASERHRLLFLCSRDGREEYGAEMLAGRPSLLDLLRHSPSCRPPLGALLDALPPLAARMYSLSCSPLECPGKVQVAFTIVRYNTERYGSHQGVTTTWLHRLCDSFAQPLSAAAAGAPAPTNGAAGGATAAASTGLRLPIFLRRGGAFGPPESLETPIIMIGPGTGVTPFRGFLQHRRAQLVTAGEGAAAAKGAAWLYFGCRREDQDYLYRQDLEAFSGDGTLDRLHVAFSRAQENKVYVQHLMQQHASELYELIARQNARVYLCGDGASMAKDVQACLSTILQQQGSLTEAEAAEQLAEMTRQGRYVRDIWS